MSVKHCRPLIRVRDVVDHGSFFPSVSSQRAMEPYLPKHLKNYQLQIMFYSLDEMMCRKWALQWCGDMGNEPKTRNVLLAWMEYGSWNTIDSQQCYKIYMTQ